MDATFKETYDSRGNSYEIHGSSSFGANSSTAQSSGSYLNGNETANPYEFDHDYGLYKYGNDDIEHSSQNLVDSTNDNVHNNPNVNSNLIFYYNNDNNIGGESVLKNMPNSVYLTPADCNLKSVDCFVSSYNYNNENVKQQIQILPTASTEYKSNDNSGTLMGPPNDELTMKLLLKRERNRIAARKCRDKKLNKIKEYEIRVSELTKEIAVIREDIAKYDVRRNELRMKMANFLCWKLGHCKCPNFINSSAQANNN